MGNFCINFTKEITLMLFGRQSGFTCTSIMHNIINMTQKYRYRRKVRSGGWGRGFLTCSNKSSFLVWRPHNWLCLVLDFLKFSQSGPSPSHYTALSLRIFGSLSWQLAKRFKYFTKSMHVLDFFGLAVQWNARSFCDFRLFTE